MKIKIKIKLKIYNIYLNILKYNILSPVYEKKIRYVFTCFEVKWERNRKNMLRKVMRIRICNILMHIFRIK